MADTNDSPQDKDQRSIFVDPNKYQLLGFLQMCIERRFHAAVQERFQKETKLGATDYWIHTGVGGSPQMEGDDQAPDYVYDPRRGAKIMGWSAHGSDCGGFPEGTDDDTILLALKETLEKRRAKYRSAKHLGFFAKKGQIEGEVEVLFIE